MKTNEIYCIGLYTFVHIPKFVKYILWNQSCSWGPMLVDCQKFALDRARRYFVGNEMQVNSLLCLMWGRKFVVNGNKRNP